MSSIEMEESNTHVDASVLLDQLTHVEQLAEDILSDRQEITDLDRKRNKTREAIRALKKNDAEKTWLCAGNTFLKFEKKKAVKLLDKDFEELDKEIVKIQTGLKPKVNQLRNLENKEELKGFQLKALSKEEWNSVKSVI